MPLDQYLDNMRSIVQHVRRIGANATVIITPPPIYEPDRLTDRQRKHGVNDRTALPERTNEMTGACALVDTSPCRALVPISCHGAVLPAATLRAEDSMCTQQVNTQPRVGSSACSSESRCWTCGRSCRCSQTGMRICRTGCTSAPPATRLCTCSSASSSGTSFQRSGADCCRRVTVVEHALIGAFAEVTAMLYAGLTLCLGIFQCIMILTNVIPQLRLHSIRPQYHCEPKATRLHRRSVPTRAYSRSYTLAIFWCDWLSLTTWT